MFALTEQTKAKMLDVDILSQKGRQPDENSGVKLTIECSLSNNYLGFFDGALKGWLFERGPAAGQGQQKLEGVEEITDAPNLTRIGMRIGTLKWKDEGTGYTVEFDFGTGGKSNVVLKDCTVYGWKLTPKEGGSFVAKFNIDCADVPDPAFLKLRKWKCLEVFINKIQPPELAQAELHEEGDRAQPPAPVVVAKGKAKKGAAAAAAAAPVAPPAPAAKTTVSRKKKEWPFGTNGDANAPAAGSAEQLTPEKALADSVAKEAAGAGA